MMTGRTLPTLGAIKRQTISGVISTGTHGSGLPTLSHFVTGVRLAAYDPATGQPAIFEYTEGAELQAARCGLGCMGVILSVDLVTVPKYQVTETIRSCRNLSEILGTYEDWPLTQFLFLPHSWEWVAYQRRPREPTEPPQGPLRRYLLRFFSFASTDVFFHLGIITCRRLGAPWVKRFLRLTPRLILKNIERIDDAEHLLTLHHHLFRHEEMEVFVRELRLAEAVELVRAILTAFAAAGDPIPADVAQKLRSVGLLDQLEAGRGTFVCHYPLFFRRVMPDDTLVSMTSSAPEPYYSMSFFTYDPPRDRLPDYTLCSLLARCLNLLTRRACIGANTFHWSLQTSRRSTPRSTNFAGFVSGLIRTVSSEMPIRHAY